MKRKIIINAIPFEVISKQKTVGDIRRLTIQAGINPQTASKELLKRVQKRVGVKCAKKKLLKFPSRT